MIRAPDPLGIHQPSLSGRHSSGKRAGLEEAAGVVGAITSSKVQISFGSTHPDIMRAPCQLPGPSSVLPLSPEPPPLKPPAQNPPFPRAPQIRNRETSILFLLLSHPTNIRFVLVFSVHPSEVLNPGPTPAFLGKIWKKTPPRVLPQSDRVRIYGGGAGEARFMVS